MKLVNGRKFLYYTFHENKLVSIEVNPVLASNSATEDELKSIMEIFLEEWSELVYINNNQLGEDKLIELDELGLINLCKIPEDEIYYNLTWINDIIDNISEEVGIKCELFLI